MLPFKTIIKRAWNHFFIKLKYVWLFIGGLVLSLIPILYYFLFSSLNNGEPFFRISGFILQLFFVMVVLKSMAEISKEFGRPITISSIIDAMVEWFRDIPTIFTGKVYNLKAKSLNQITSFGAINSTISPNPDAELEERLEFLERRYTELEKSTNNRFRKVDKEVKNINELVKQEKKNRKANIERMSEFFERISTHGFKREAMGLIWLIIGLLFSIFPQELTYILT